MKKITFFLLLLLFDLSATYGQIITTIAGTGISGYNGDTGSAITMKLQYPSGLRIDTVGNLYVADEANFRIRQISSFGFLKTLAGNGNPLPPCSGNGGPAISANIGSIFDVALDKKGNVYVLDEENSLLRKVDKSGNISIVAGVCGSAGYNGDGISANSALLYYPMGVSLDTRGNIYIADANNNRIRVVDTLGMIHTFAGNGSAGFSGDGGQATSAQLYGPTNIFIDSKNNIYISDNANDRIRKVDTSHIITTIAGNGFGAPSSGAFSGDGGPATVAELYAPSGICLDKNDNIFFADSYNNRIRQINTSGIISTVAGNGVQGYNGDGGPATAAELFEPLGVCIDKNGDIYIGDTGNNRVRKVSAPAGVDELHNIVNVSVYPNPSQGRFTFSLSGKSNNVRIEVYNMLGDRIYSKTSSILNSPFEIDLSDKPNGVYFYRVLTQQGNLVGEGKLIKQ